MKEHYNLSYPAKIPLQDILLANGYEIDRSKSTSRNPALESSKGDKLIISLLPNGDYLYFNANDNNDRGNIYNFCKNNKIDINILLENYLKAPLQKTYKIKSLDEHKQNAKEVSKHFLNLPSYNTELNYYLKNRGLDSSIINSYNKNIKVDSYHNIYFPQYALLDSKFVNICGYTMKLSQPIYSKDGEMLPKPIKSITKGNKGLEILTPNETKNISKIIISESSIDNLSFLEIAKMDNALAVATSGSNNISKSMELLKVVSEKFNINEFHLVFDNDTYGERLREGFKEALLEQNMKVYKHIPLSKDFNDDLKLFKSLKITNFREYHWNSVDKEQLKASINAKCEDLFDDFRYAKRGEKRANILKTLRKIDKILPLEQKLKDRFNNYEFKDKRIREL